MKSPKVELFEKPSLHNTASPTIITYAEYASRKSAVISRYPGQNGDLLMFYLMADIGYPFLDMLTPTADSFEFPKYIDSGNHSMFVGKQIQAFFTVIRHSRLLGISRTLNFEILDK
ncbi:hypothetical protein J1G18_23480 [Pseudomonas sp. MIS38]|jgi:hypothetical protein|uniref:hypothetical protein n=1 Tax=Pseudomonas TaxID=286 RepID=UPI000BA2C8D6|nr:MULTISPECIES: hypothetical protein [Pseudomonas]MBY8960266.1 hypothetical protein [Pseudomonas sp. MIS38]NHW98854.1 hypothetical protein [Pseudomonas koreensis]